MIIERIAVAIAVEHAGQGAETAAPSAAAAEAGENSFKPARRGLSIGFIGIGDCAARAGHRADQRAKTARAAELADNLAEHIAGNAALLGGIFNSVAWLRMIVDQCPHRGFGDGRRDAHFLRYHPGNRVLASAAKNSVKQTHIIDSRCGAASWPQSAIGAKA